MSPIHFIEKFFDDHGIGKAHILVAASGGTDSTALLLLLHENFPGRIRTSAVHLNHELRGAESDGDERFVRTLCGDYGIPLHVIPAPLDPEATRAVGVEAAARRLRYAAFREIKAQTGAQFVATAHQKNDQAETVLMRLISGSGIDRLGGIQPITEEGIIRPLLDVERRDLTIYLQEKGVTPRQDQSNVDDRFLRNRIRSRLIPLLMEWNPSIVDTLSETSLQAREQSRVLRNLILTESASWISEFQDRTEFALGQMPADDWLIRAALALQIRRLDPDARDVSAADIRRIAAGLANPGASSITGRLEIVRKSDRVVLHRKHSPVDEDSNFALPLHPGEEVGVPQLRAKVRLRSCAASEAITLTGGGETQFFQIPPAALPAFVIRTRRSGDRFRPLGMSGQKKLTDFMIDRKIPAGERDRIPLLTWNGQVVWVPGVEISEDFKVRNRDHDIYEVRILFDQ